MFELESKNQDEITIITKKATVKFNIAEAFLDAGLAVGKIKVFLNAFQALFDVFRRIVNGNDHADFHRFFPLSEDIPAFIITNRKGFYQLYLFGKRIFLDLRGIRKYFFRKVLKRLNNFNSSLQWLIKQEAISSH